MQEGVRVVDSIADGNCLFNAGTLRLLDAIKADQLDIQLDDNGVTQTYKAAVQQRVITLFNEQQINNDADWSWEDIKDYLRRSDNYKDQKNLQLALAPALRRLASDLAADESQSIRFKAATVAALTQEFREYLANIPRSSRHYFDGCVAVQKKMEELRNGEGTTEEKIARLINWYQEGNADGARAYLNYLSQPGIWAHDIFMEPVAKHLGFGGMEVSFAGQGRADTFSNWGNIPITEMLSNQQINQLRIRNVVTNNRPPYQFARFTLDELHRRLSAIGEAPADLFTRLQSLRSADETSAQSERVLCEEWGWSEALIAELKQRNLLIISNDRRRWKVANDLTDEDIRLRLTAVENVEKIVNIWNQNNLSSLPFLKLDYVGSNHFRVYTDHDWLKAPPALGRKTSPHGRPVTSAF